MKNGIQHPRQALWIFGYAVWTNQRTSCIPVFCQWSSSKSVSVCLLRWNADLFSSSRNPWTACAAGPQRLLHQNLYVKAEKCEFHTSTVSFLGFIVSRNTVSMDPEKVRAVKDWPTTSSHKQLQRFWGLLIFIANSLISGQLLLLLFILSPVPRFRSSGLSKPKRLLTNSRRDSPQRQS